MPGNEYIRIRRIELVPEYLSEFRIIDVRTALNIHFEFEYREEDPGNLLINLQVFSQAGSLIFELASPNIRFKKGVVKGESRIPGNFMNDGLYYISIAFVRNSVTRLFYMENCLSFEVEDYKDSRDLTGNWPGVVRPSFPVTLIQD